MPQALAVLLVVSQLQAAEQAAAPAQAPAAPPAGNPPPQPPAPPTPAVVPLAGNLPVEQNLKIRVLAGSGEMNDLERRVMAPLVVQVVDQDERAMEGAQVVFRFPLDPPNATFLDGKTSVTVRTNGSGQAAAVNWMASGVGTFQVHVNATYGNQVGEATVSMTNVNRIVNEARKTKSGESLWSHGWFKIAVIGGAALAVGLGVYFGTRGGKSGTTVGVSTGPPTVTSP